MWMYVVQIAITALWIVLLKNVWRFYQSEKLQKSRILAPLVSFCVGRVSEWHVLLTTFLFDPREQRVVWADLVTPDGL